MTTEYVRWAEKSVAHSLSVRRVVNIIGARQCGKTTLTRHLKLEGAVLRTLDDDILLRAAKEDPSGFLQHPAGTTLVLDEIQKAPVLLSAIKKMVDENNAPGQFLLTGSADLHAIPAVNESLAGRMRTIRLRTLTEGEIRGTLPLFLERAFKGKFPLKIPGGDKKTILGLAFRGGYPEAVSLPQEERKAWHKDYLDNLLLRDIHDISNIRKYDTLRGLASALAARSAKFLNINELCVSHGVTKPTVDNYISALEAMYLFERVDPWAKGDYDRIGKRPKWYVADSGTMAACLNWRQNEVLLDPDRSGKLMETWVFHELSAQVDLDPDCSLFHYRDRANREIDFLVEDGDGNILGIEVKAGSVVRKDDFVHMIWFRDNLAKGKFQGITLYSGEDTVSFGDGLLALPLAALYQ